MALAMITVLALFAGLLVLLPILSVASSVFVPASDALDHVLSVVLVDVVANTVVMMIVVAIATAVIGTTTAWLVAMCRFPGRRLFSWLLLLPMAMPGFIIGYAYTDFLMFTGPVQTALRSTFGWSKSDYWFPDVHNVGGVSIMLSLVLYPYVYFIVRAAFLEQSTNAFEVARTLGHGTWSCFFRIALPLARPAIAAGVALALMETLADFGTVQYFGVHTFTTVIYRTWFGMSDKAAAGQLATMLLGFVAMLLLAERAARSRRRFHKAGRKEIPIQLVELRGLRAALAIAACGLPVFFGFVLPVAILVNLHAAGGDDLFGGRFVGLAANSLALAVGAAVVVTAVAALVAYALRVARHPRERALLRLSTLGYALPGTVVAVGILGPLGALDHVINSVAQRLIGAPVGLIVSGSVAALVFAYLVRFLAVATNTLEAGLEKIPVNLDHVARTLGCSPARVLTEVHVPLLWRSSLTALVLVFADVLKELPATLIVRPFNMETLAVRVYQLASDERLAQASTGALTIVALSLLPLIVLTRSMDHQRTG